MSFFPSMTKITCRIFLLSPKKFPSLDQSIFLLNNIHYFMCMSVIPACISVYHRHSWCWQEAVRGHKIPGNEVKGSFRLPCGHWEWNRDLLLLTTEVLSNSLPMFQPQCIFLSFQQSYVTNLILSSSSCLWISLFWAFHVKSSHVLCDVFFLDSFIQPELFMAKPCCLTYQSSILLSKDNLPLNRCGIFLATHWLMGIGCFSRLGQNEQRVRNLVYEFFLNFFLISLWQRLTVGIAE